MQCIRRAIGVGEEETHLENKHRQLQRETKLKPFLMKINHHYKNFPFVMHFTNLYIFIIFRLSEAMQLVLVFFKTDENQGNMMHIYTREVHVSKYLVEKPKQILHVGELVFIPFRLMST